ncbi:MAG TPA: hypothetical protein VIZ21_06185 [Ignavibacteriaceae bacterium]
MIRATEEALSKAFPNMNNKEQAIKGLLELAQDNGIDVSSLNIVNYLLGKVFIYKAVETENPDNFRKELKKALDFFEKSANEASVTSIM